MQHSMQTSVAVLLGCIVVVLSVKEAFARPSLTDTTTGARIAHHGLLEQSPSAPRDPTRRKAPTVALSGEAFVNQTYYLVGNFSDFNNSIELIEPGTPLPLHRDVLVTVIFNRSFTEVGWDFLQVSVAPYFFTAPATPDLFGASLQEAAVLLSQQGYYYAGLAEGWVTGTQLYSFYASHMYEYTPAVAGWVQAHQSYVESRISEFSVGNGTENATMEAQFWRQTGNHWLQMEGIANGVVRSGAGQLAFADVFRFNFRYEVGDVVNAVSGETENDVTKLRRSALHCSALIKVTDDELFMAHDTWGSYVNMVRQYKVYAFQTTVAFSGFAGQIHSGDDWYITSHYLGAQETTNEYFGTALAKEYIKPQCNSEFIRVMVSNFLADSGQEWTQLFGMHHSGTYCNQYMVVDYKLYVPGERGSMLQDNLLWIIEEMPGNVTSADVTETLRTDGYWASYNVPYFRNIYVDSGFEAMKEAFGSFFSYQHYARPEIFRRNQSDVLDLETMKALMLYNDWQYDPYSIIPNCSYCTPTHSPLLSIAARGDLVPTVNVTLPWNHSYARYFGHGMFGAYDSKIASYAMLTNGMQSAVYCGPTPQQGYFSWSANGVEPPPAGCVDTYNFSWTTFNVVGARASSTTSSQGETGLIVGLVLGIPCGLIAVGLVTRTVIKRRRTDAYGYTELYSAE